MCFNASSSWYHLLVCKLRLGYILVILTWLMKQKRLFLGTICKAFDVTLDNVTILHDCHVEGEMCYPPKRFADYKCPPPDIDRTVSSSPTIYKSLLHPESSSPLNSETTLSPPPRHNFISATTYANIRRTSSCKPTSSVGSSSHIYENITSPPPRHNFTSSSSYANLRRTSSCSSASSANSSFVTYSALSSTTPFSAKLDQIQKLLKEEMDPVNILCKSLNIDTDVSQLDKQLASMWKSSGPFKQLVNQTPNTNVTGIMFHQNTLLFMIKLFVLIHLTKIITFGFVKH